MKKDLYDYSCLIWSPEGKLYQVEYAMEAVKQGTCLMGVRSDTHVVLCGLRNKQHELAFYQDKLFKVSNNLGIGLCGLTADGRLLYKNLKNDCLNYNYVYNSEYPTERLVSKIAEKSQLKTQRGESKRPIGVGLLVAGYDKSGPRLFRTCPSGNYFEYICTAMGARSQTANTYLENRIEEFKLASLDQLIRHAIEGMKKSQDFEITVDNIHVSIVGHNQEFKILSPQDLSVFFVNSLSKNLGIASKHGDNLK